MIPILVQSSFQSPYDIIMESQLRTWDSVYNDNTITYYYFGGEYKIIPLKNGSIKILTGTSDSYNMMHWKFKIALEEVYKNKDWNFIFRTQTSSYINKRSLVEFSKFLPEEKCYCGMELENGYASGSGFFISRDVVEIIINDYKEDPQPFEDCYLGEVLSKKGIGITKGADRVDYYFGGDINRKTYHYFCKPSDNDPNKTISAFDYLYKNFEY